MLLTIDERGYKIARNSVKLFDCHFWPQMATDKSVSNDCRSTFVDSMNIFDCPLSGLRNICRNV